MADNPSPSKFDNIKWYFENAPKGMNPLNIALMAMGVKGNGLGQYYQQYYNQAIRRGQNPYEVLPWLRGSQSSSTNANNANPLASMPQWYQDWFNSQGKTGGVRGIL